MMDATISILGTSGDWPSVSAVFPGSRDLSRCCLQAHTSAERGEELIGDPIECLPCGGLYDDTTPEGFVRVEDVVWVEGRLDEVLQGVLLGAEFLGEPAPFERAPRAFRRGRHSGVARR